MTEHEAGGTEGITPPEAPPSVQKGYEAARHPEPQGDGDPGPDPADDRTSASDDFKPGDRQPS